MEYGKWLKERINRVLAGLGVQIVRTRTVRALELKAAAPSHHDTLIRVLAKMQIRQYWRIRDMVGDQHDDSAQVRCPICGNIQRGVDFPIVVAFCRFGGGRLDRKQCPTCEIIWGPDKIMKLTEEELSEEYNYHYAVYEEGDSTENELRAFYELEPDPSGVYVNFGAGKWSRSGALLRAQGWKVFDYEPHSIGTSDRTDFRITAWEELLGRQVDGIYSNNVLEHLRDPVGTLRGLRAVVKPGGRMVHATPCFEYCYEYTRFHVMFYVSQSARIACERAGWDVIGQTNDGDYRSIVVSC